MKMLVEVTIPCEKFNKAVKKGNADEKLGKIIETINPEFIYFTERNGDRAATMAVDIQEPSQIPSIAEPWFLTFEAHCHFQIAMTPKDLSKAGLEKIAEMWCH